jgi:hypothetical protein
VLRPAVFLALLVIVLPAEAQNSFKAVNPEVQRIVDGVSRDRLEAIVRKLEGFQSRSTLSDTTSTTRGIGAARQWIYDQFKSFSPRLEVSFDTYKVAKTGRITKDVDLRNVIAVLPGTDPIGRNRRILISGHYDSTLVGPNAEQQTEKAPGANDDGSGTAAVLEAARLLSRYEFPHTLVFVAFAGEEQGLVGSTLLAARARKENWQIDAVLNNDIVGNSAGGNGLVDNHTLRVFSEDPNDSPSRQVARYVQDIGPRYTPSMVVDLIFRYDRFGRGGDHTPFNLENYAAVRLTVSNENYSRQHTVDDTFEGVDLDYLARVTRVNVASLATLGRAPSAPFVTDEMGRPMLGRGQSRYDAELKWKASEGKPAGYVVVMRKTTSPDWEREIYVGNVTEYVLKDVSIDEWVIGVRAIGQNGEESLTSAYVNPTRTKSVYQTLP